MSKQENFQLIREQGIPERNTLASLYRHNATGAEVLSLENDDKNKVFGITFRTPPPDETGIPHIMEHSVLCGSRKYPVKEPFVELIKGSLQTFLNAFTFPDKTCYPVASQNLQDFYNLIDVYLDAVFYPRITRHTLEQEGWHYELEEEGEEMFYKGVVFNEMKGAYSSPARMILEYSQRSLFPNHPYGVDSGGAPEKIPNLTYKQFCAFHKKFYHPSNARIFFSGDDPPAERLKLLQEYLKDFEAIENDSAIPLMSRFTETKRVVVPYDAGVSDGQSRRGFVTVNWLLGEVTDASLYLPLSILSEMLLGSSGSPLRKALIESGLGEGLLGSGLENEFRQMSFTTGLKGVNVEDADKVEALVLKTLEGLCRDGIDSAAVDAACNTVEFGLREANTGAYPQGLIAMLESLTTWLYDGDPLEPLFIDAPFEMIRKAMKDDNRYWEGLIKTWFLENAHRSTVVLKPDGEIGKKKKEEEATRLAEIQGKMSEGELKAIIENTKELKALQIKADSPEALATIPRLALKDLDKENPKIPIEKIQMNGVEVLFHDLFTQGIFYLDLAFSLRGIPQALLPFVPVFGRALLETGTDKEDFVTLSQRIGKETGGIHAKDFCSACYGRTESEVRIVVRGKCMEGQIAELMDILQDVLSCPRLDNKDRFLQIVLSSRAKLEASLVSSGHQIVGTRLSASLHPSGAVSDSWNGIGQLLFLRDLEKRVKEDWNLVLEDLKKILNAIYCQSRCLFNVSCPKEMLEKNKTLFSSFLSSLPSDSTMDEEWDFPSNASYEGLMIPSQVNFVGKGANLFKMGYQFHASALVVGKFLRTAWLWERVRVRGGAYGGFSQFSPRSGNFLFLSYRDPNLEKTIQIYDETAAFLKKLSLSQEEIEKNIIGAIGDLDSYQLPDAKGYTSMGRFLTGESDEVLQKMRNEIFETEIGHFRAFGEILSELSKKGRVTVLGGEGPLEAWEQKEKHLKKIM